LQTENKKSGDENQADENSLLQTRVIIGDELAPGRTDEEEEKNTYTDEGNAASTVVDAGSREDGDSAPYGGGWRPHWARQGGRGRFESRGSFGDRLRWNRQRHSSQARTASGGHSTDVSLSCDAGLTISITSTYVSSECSRETDTSKGETDTSKAKGVCDGKASCNVGWNGGGTYCSSCTDIRMGDPCPGKAKTLHANYMCKIRINEAKATCDMILERNGCSGATPVNKGSDVTCSGNAAKCDASTCCEAKATCDSIVTSCEDVCWAGWGCGARPVNKGSAVECLGNAATCDASSCCEACVDGTPSRSTCAYMATYSDCAMSKWGSVRRRFHLGDVKDNCRLTCGYCATSHQARQSIVTYVWNKKTSKYCYKVFGPAYSSQSAAQSACSLDTQCIGVNDALCDNNGDFLMCHASSTLKTSSQGSCVYMRTQASTPYKKQLASYIRFTPTKLRNPPNYPAANSIQISEIAFANGGSQLDLSTATLTNPGGHSPPGSPPANVIDGKSNTKWLDFNKGGLLFFFPDAMSPDRFSFTTAHDAPERDPVSWKVELSMDGLSYTTVQQETDYSTPTTRGTQTPWFPFALYGEARP